MVAGSGDAEHGGGTGTPLLEERVRRLEKDVEELREQVRTQAQARVQAIAETHYGGRVETPTETPGEAATPTAERPARREIVSSPFAEATRNPVRCSGGDVPERGPLFGLFPDGLPPATWWVARAGVVLLLVGVSFLLRMGVEQGWLTPAVRVTGGVVIGVALSAFGLRARTSRPAYSQLLVGGGVVAFYLSAFGAWSVWQLVPYEAAFAFCVLATAFAFAAAVRLSAEWLALLGVVGGYATPFMLLSPDSNVPALVGYSLLLLGGYLMVYVFRGWRSVYGTAILGIWAILAVSDLGARTYTTSIEGVLPTDTAWSVSTGALVAWLTILFITSGRRYLLANAGASVSSENGVGGSGVLTETAATSVAPLFALLFVWSAWPSENLSGVHLASLALAMALVHLAAYAVVANRALLSSSSSVADRSREQQGNGGGQAYGGSFEASALAGLLEDRSAESSIALALRYAKAQAFVVVVLLTLAVVFLLDGAALASALAVEGALLAYLVRPSEGDDTAPRLSGRRLTTAKSWLLLTFAALYSLGAVAWRATDPFGATGGEDAYLPFLNGDAVSLLVVVASLFFVSRMGEWADAASWRGVAAGLRLLGHLILALGVVAEFARSDLPSGASFAFLALYALALALARFFSDRNLPTTGGPRVPSPAPSWVAHLGSTSARCSAWSRRGCGSALTPLGRGRIIPRPPPKRCPSQVPTSPTSSASSCCSASLGSSSFGAMPVGVPRPRGRKKDCCPRRRCCCSRLPPSSRCVGPGRFSTLSRAAARSLASRGACCPPHSSPVPPSCSPPRHERLVRRGWSTGLPKRATPRSHLWSPSCSSTTSPR